MAVLLVEILSSLRAASMYIYVQWVERCWKAAISSTPVDLHGAIFLCDIYFPGMNVHCRWAGDGIWERIGWGHFCYSSLEFLGHHPISVFMPGADMLALKFWILNIPLLLIRC